MIYYLHVINVTKLLSPGEASLGHIYMLVVPRIERTKSLRQDPLAFGDERR
jgi:hypothetical protein